MKKAVIRRVIEEIKDYMGTKEIIISLLTASLLLFLSFFAHTRTEVIPITTTVQTMDVPNAHYGFPFEMLTILTPVTSPQAYQIDRYTMDEGNSRFQILWGGMVLNLVIYFMLAFVMIYLFERFGARA